MKRHGVRELQVLESGTRVGSVVEMDVLEKLVDGRASPSSSASEVMIPADFFRLAAAAVLSDRARTVRAPDERRTTDSFLRPCVVQEDGLGAGVRVGSTQYAFVEPLEIRCEPVDASSFEFRVDGFPAVRGATRVDAEERWALGLHGAIQLRQRGDDASLTAIAPEWAEADWEKLERLVDLDALARTAPFTVRQGGKVLERDLRGLRVRWIGFEDHEDVPFVLAPATLAGCRVDDRIDALVEREPGTWRLIEILGASRLPALSEDRVRARLDSAAAAPSIRDVCEDAE